MEYYEQKNPSPCHNCTRVKDPSSCENKLCGPWRNWFLSRWAEINLFYQRAQEECKPEFVADTIPEEGKNNELEI